jgi:hypothetical protein
VTFIRFTSPVRIILAGIVFSRRLGLARASEAAQI